MILRAALLISSLLLSLPAAAQAPIIQSGTVTPGHPLVWITDGVAADGGTAAMGALSGIGITASGLLLFNAPSLQNAFLLCMAVWGFARFYYFAFYVIEHYIDPAYRFAGLIAFAQYLLRKPRK